MLHDAESKEPSVRRPALELLAITWARLGAYGDALAIDEALAASDPRDRAAHRRLVHCLLRLGRYDDAVVRAEELVAIDPADRLSAEHLRVARWAREIAAAPNRFPPGTVIDLLPLPTLAAPSP